MYPIYILGSWSKLMSLQRFSGQRPPLPGGVEGISETRPFKDQGQQGSEADQGHPEVDNGGKRRWAGQLCQRSELFCRKGLSRLG